MASLGTIISMSSLLVLAVTKDNLVVSVPTVFKRPLLISISTPFTSYFGILIPTEWITFLKFSIRLSPISRDFPFFEISTS